MSVATTSPLATNNHRLENLVVADGRLQHGVPVHQSLAAIDKPILKHAEESVPDRAGADRVEREARALPIAARSHLLELLNDAGLVLVLPLPDALDQSFAAQIVPAFFLFFQEPPLDDRLRGDAGVIVLLGQIG